MLVYQYQSDKRCRLRKAQAHAYSRENTESKLLARVNHYLKREYGSRSHIFRPNRFIVARMSHNKYTCQVYCSCHTQETLLHDMYVHVHVVGSASTTVPTYN